MFCKQCGNEIPDNPIFPTCPKCNIQTDNFIKKDEAVDISLVILVTGYVLVFVIPPIGGIIGIQSMLKGKPEHGLFMLVLSLVSFLYWLDFTGFLTFEI